MFCRKTFAIIIFGLFFALSATAAFGVNLRGGTVTINLQAGNNSPTFQFTNKTWLPICDLLLSTNNSKLIDPDFQGGPVVVRMPPGGADLGWHQWPPSGDGVEDVKVVALFKPDDCIPINNDFSVEMVFDGVAAGDILKVTPTDSTQHQIQPKDTLTLENCYRLFNGYEGLPGSLDGVYVGFNGLTFPVERIRFESRTSGVSVAQVTSTLPSVYDPTSGILEFSVPIATGAPLDFNFSVDTLAPFVQGDPDPFTVVCAIVVEDIPTLTEWGLIIFCVLLFGWMAWVIVRRRKAVNVRT